MARIRTIKPEFWGDYRMAQELSRDERLFYVALWNQADDEGRFLAHPRRLLGAVFPYDEDITAKHVRGWLDKLAATGRLTIYEVNGEPYAQLTHFSKHQKINRPQPSRIPPPDGMEDSWNVHGTFMERSSPERKGMEGNGSDDAPTSGAPSRKERKPKKTPMPEGWEPNEKHRELARREGRDFDREVFKFRDKAGANAYRYADWDKAFSSWLRNENYRAPSSNGAAVAMGGRKIQPDFIVEP